MAEQEERTAARRRRVQRLKRLIVGFFLTLLLLPSVLCIIIFFKMESLEKQMYSLNLQVEEAKISQVERMAALEAELARVREEKETVLPPVDASVQDVGSEGVILLDEPGSEEEEAIPVDSPRKVYLTFDDGPSSNTDKILDILAEYDVKATFFVVGKEGEWAEEAYRRIVEEGHTLGMHSYTHEYSQVYASVDAFAEDLNRLKDYLYEVTGTESKFVRFPGGSSNTVSDIDMREFIYYLYDQDITYFDWNVSSQDASRTKLSANQILNNCLSGMGNRSTVVILMHDTASKDTTVEALPTLIEAILAMDNTELLPITEDTVPVQHITITHEETEE